MSGSFPRVSSTRSPSAVTRLIARTPAASATWATPEPWVPVELAPATEMCGRDPMFGSARPASQAASARSP